MRRSLLCAALSLALSAASPATVRTTLSVTGEVRVSGKVQRVGTTTTVNGWMLISRPVWVLHPGSRVKTGDRGILVLLVGRGTPKKGSVTEEILPNSLVEVDARGRLIVREGKALRKQSGRPDVTLKPVPR